MIVAPTLSELFEMYRTDVIIFKNQSLKTEENHLVCMKSVIRFIGNIPACELTFPMVREWKNHLTKTRSDATVRNYIIKLRVVLSFGVTRGYSCLNPDTIPIPRRADTVASYLTADEVQRMIDTCDTHHRSSIVAKARLKALISMLYGSGLRLSELINLDKNQIINDSFTVVGKGGKARLCFLDPRTASLISLYLELRSDNHPALYVSDRSTVRMRLTGTNIQLAVRCAARRAGIDRHVTPHTLRHSFATNYGRNNGNLRHLQLLMGHQSLDTTAHYMHVVNEDLRRSYDIFHTT